MRLSNKAKAILKSRDGVRIRTLIALSLDKSVPTIQRYLDSDDDNLTKAAAIDVIKKETGLSEDQILERQPDSSTLIH